MSGDMYVWCGGGECWCYTIFKSYLFMWCYGMVAVINMLCGLGFIEVLMVVNAATPIISPV